MKEVYYFSAPWCAPCKLLSPVLDSMAEFFAEKQVSFKKVNIDDQTTLVQRFRVRSVPALYLVQNGDVQDSIIGFTSESATKHTLRKFANDN